MKTLILTALVFSLGVLVGHFGPKVVWKETVSTAKIVKEKGKNIADSISEKGN